MRRVKISPSPVPPVPVPTCRRCSTWHTISDFNRRLPRGRWRGLDRARAPPSVWVEKKNTARAGTGLRGWRWRLLALVLFRVRVPNEGDNGCPIPNIIVDGLGSKYVRTTIKGHDTSPEITEPISEISNRGHREQSIVSARTRSSRRELVRARDQLA